MTNQAMQAIASTMLAFRVKADVAVRISGDVEVRLKPRFGIGIK
jgi:hypothetical protein